MLVSIFIGVIIFGYAAYILWKSFQKSKQGKCAGCAIKNTCQGSICVQEEKDNEVKN